jgi:hypothetical protein
MIEQLPHSLSHNFDLKHTVALFMRRKPLPLELKKIALLHSRSRRTEN